MTVVPMKAEVAPKVRARKQNQGGYDLVVGGEAVFLPRVTSILQVMSKPALVNWQVRTVEDAVKRNAAGLYEELCWGTPITAEEFMARLNERLGAEREDEKIVRKAADIGSNVHKYIQWHVHRSAGRWDDVKEPALESDEAKRAVDAWLAWWEPLEKEPVMVEERVYNLTHQYAGTEDWKGYIEGVLTDLDWKTSSGIYDEALLQNAAYANAMPYAEGLVFKRAERGMIVRLPKRKGDVFDPTSPEWVRTISAMDQDRYFDLFCKARDLYRFVEGR